MPALRRSTSLAAVLVLCAQPAVAWAPETRVRMVDEAVRFMPASLRLALENHREPLLRGALGPTVNEDDPDHHPPWADGALDRKLDAEINELIESLRQSTPFRELAARFGSVAHYVSDAGFPPGVSDGDGAERYQHFAAFCEDRRERFPLVFYGHEDPELERSEFRAFALRVMQRAASEDRTLARAYAAAGDPPHPMAFDDRSVPFAVASLAYSRSITEIVRVWLTAWSRANGDMDKTPYYERRP